MFTPSDNCGPTGSNANERYKSFDNFKHLINAANWVWPGWIANGYVTMIVAPPEAGKSFLALRIAGSVTDGRSNVDGTPYVGATGNVLWLEYEGGTALHVTRLLMLNIDPKKILTASHVHDNGDIAGILNKSTQASIEDLLINGDIKMVVLDSLSGSLIDVDENSTQMGKPLQYLSSLAERHGIPVVVIHHMNKPGWNTAAKRPTMDKIRGSGSIAQYPRTIISLDHPIPDDSQTIRACIMKNNMSAAKAALAYKIDSGSFTILNLSEVEAQAKATDDKVSLQPFTQQESEVINHLIKGLSIRCVADLCKTSKTTVARIKQKALKAGLLLSSGVDGNDASLPSDDDDDGSIAPIGPGGGTPSPVGTAVHPYTFGGTPTDTGGESRLRYHPINTNMIPATLDEIEHLEREDHTYE